MKIWSLALGLALLIPTSTLGATSLVVGIQDHRLNIDTGFLDDLDPVENNQKSLRATFTWDVNETFTVVAEGGGASSFLELTDETITGMTDLRLRGLYRVTDRWVLGAGTIVPFGLYELTSAEATTAQWTWNPRSGFPISSFGEGFGWEVTTAYGFPLGTDVTAGVAAAWLTHAEFDLLDFGGAYQIGDELSTSLAIDYAPANGSRLRLRGGYVVHGTDLLGGKDYIEQGNQFNFGASLGLPLGGLRTEWGVHSVFKQDNQITTHPDSLLQVSQAPGTYLVFTGHVGAPLSSSVLLTIDGVYTKITDSEYTIGANGSYTSFGPGLGVTFSPNFSASGRVSIVDGDGDDDLAFDGLDWLVTMEFRP